MQEQQLGFYSTEIDIFMEIRKRVTQVFQRTINLYKGNITLNTIIYYKTRNRTLTET